MNPLIAFHAVMAAWHLSWLAFWLRQFPSPPNREPDRRSVLSTDSRHTKRLYPTYKEQQEQQEFERQYGRNDAQTADSADRWLRR